MVGQYIRRTCHHLLHHHRRHLLRCNCNRRNIFLLMALRHFEEHSRGARLGTPPRLQHAISTALEVFALWCFVYYWPYGQEGWTPGHHTTSPTWSCSREHKCGLARALRKFGPAVLLPVTTKGTQAPCLQVRIQDLEIVRRRNADNARSVCWIIRTFRSVL